MTELVYYQDQYKIELEAKVLKIDGNKILLNKTIFIPKTNTEPGDFGTINNLEIRDLKKDTDNIWHIVQGEINFKVGDVVNLRLDWSKRLRAMRLHSALHLLAGPFDKLFSQQAVAGAIKGSTAYLVFKEEISDDILEKAIEQANEDIKNGNGIEIESFWDDKREGFRWAQVGEYPPIPDGGLHVKNTKEIEGIKFVDSVMKPGKHKIIFSIE